MTDWTEDEIIALMAERDAAIARAIAAEQMVAELRAVLVRRHAHDVAGGICDTPERCSCDDDVTAILEQAAPIAGRWCLASERDEAMRGLDVAIATFSGKHKELIEEEARADAAEAREWALGVQVVAQAERLRLADGLAVAVREWFAIAADLDPVRNALAAYDAVQGDVDPVDLG